MMPATNHRRFDYLISLACQCEKAARGGHTYRGRKYLELAAIYYEMAQAALPSADDPPARKALAAKLKAMTTANGCTPAEADNAAQMLLRLEGGYLTNPSIHSNDTGALP
jgi:hypothetical protein